jgi:hypothetical protein
LRSLRSRSLQSPSELARFRRRRNFLVALVPPPILSHARFRASRTPDSSRLRPREERTAAAECRRPSAAEAGYGRARPPPKTVCGGIGLHEGLAGGDPQDPPPRGRRGHPKRPSAAEAGYRRGCRGKTPRTHPKIVCGGSGVTGAGVESDPPARRTLRTRPPELARKCARLHTTPPTN